MDQQERLGVHEEATVRIDIAGQSSPHPLACDRKAWDGYTSCIHESKRFPRVLKSHLNGV